MGWDRMRPAQKMALLMQQAEGISARVADLANIYNRPTAGILDVVQCVAVCCSVLQCVAVCCSVLWSAAVCR